jgi:hypothetical protein
MHLYLGMHYCERTKWSNNKNFIFDYYNMSAISGDLLSDNVNIMEDKKQKLKTKSKSSNTNMFTISNLKKITRVTLKVFTSIAMLFLGGSIFWYYGIICHAGLLQTEFPHDYYERDFEPDAPENGFERIKILKTQVPIYSMDDDNNTTRCSFVHFDEEDINTQFEGTVNNKGKHENSSLLYKLTEIKEGAEKQGSGFIKYSFINYVQRLIIADLKVINTYFEFFYSICNESVALMLGALFLIPFAPIYMICHIVSSMGLFLMSIMDIFKTGHYDAEKHKDDSSFFSTIWTLMYPIGGLTGSKSQTPDYEPLTWWDIFIRLAYLFFYCTMGAMVGIASSMFCALYSLAKVFAMSGIVDVPNTNADDKTANPIKTKPFTIFHLMKNNLHFYSRGYLIAFTLMLINQIYVDMSPTTAIGCIFAVIILVFGTNVFAKYVVDPNDFTSSGDKCDASTDRVPDPEDDNMYPEDDNMYPEEEGQYPFQQQQQQQPFNTSAPPLFGNQTNYDPLNDPYAPINANANANALNAEKVDVKLDDPKNTTIELKGGEKRIKKSSSKTQRKKIVLDVAPQ